MAQDGRIEFRPSTSGDQAGHGTACAGIIASIAPDADLYSVKVLGPKASGSGDMFLVGLDYAIKQKFRVINLSLGTTKRDFFAGLQPYGMDITPAGDLAVVANIGAGATGGVDVVSLIDLAANPPRAQHRFPSRPAQPGPRAGGSRPRTAAK